MSKKCSRCEKTVYPLEELKCLDKIWHKTCFKCQECGMALNMRTYKGFNRLPYCNAHCPQAKHTTVADTPEIRRIQENTKIQSTVKYHEDFEKQKGKVTQIADDPETLRIKQNTRIISNVAYHGDLEKKAIMEQRRPAVSGERNGDDGIEFHQEGKEEPSPVQTPLIIEKTPEPVEPVSNQDVVVRRDPLQPSHSGMYTDLEPPDLMKDSPYSIRQTSTLIYTSEHGPDYDPLNENYGSLAPGAKNDVNAQPKMPVGGKGDGDSHAMNQQNYKSTGPTYRAMYDYTAADLDEVSFMDGDFILNCTPIDEGWMTGTVQRTGQTGMLPANYVEPIN